MKMFRALIFWQWRTKIFGSPWRTCNIGPFKYLRGKIARVNSSLFFLCFVLFCSSILIFSEKFHVRQRQNCQKFVSLWNCSASANKKLDIRFRNTFIRWKLSAILANYWRIGEKKSNSIRERSFFKQKP